MLTVWVKDRVTIVNTTILKGRGASSCEDRHPKTKGALSGTLDCVNKKSGVRDSKKEDYIISITDRVWQLISSLLFVLYSGILFYHSVKFEINKWTHLRVRIRKLRC